MPGCVGSCGGNGGGITNSAGANVVPKSNGTNLVASRITDDGSIVTITGISNPVTTDPILKIKNSTGSESEDTKPLQVIGEDGSTAILDLDSYGVLVLVGASTDPTNGGANLQICGRGPSHALRFNFNADNGSGVTSADLGLGTGTTISFDSGAKTISLATNASTGVITLSSKNLALTLPTADPHIAGDAWSNLGVVQISTG